MAAKKKGLVVAAIAFANTPTGKALIQQAREYLARPETRQKGLELLAQARTRGQERYAARAAGRTDPPSAGYRPARTTDPGQKHG